MSMIKSDTYKIIIFKNKCDYKVKNLNKVFRTVQIFITLFLEVASTQVVQGRTILLT